MAEPQSVTMYKEGRDPIKISGSKTLAAAKAKGWSTQEPQTPLHRDAAPSTVSQPQGPAGGAGGDFSDPAIKNTGLVGGFGKGLNPFHQTPAGLPDSKGISGNLGADMFNTREIGAMANVGNTKGAIGEGLGTGVAMLGPEIIKGMGMSIKGIRGFEGASRAARAAERAADLQKEIKGPVKVARIAADYTQPIVDEISKSYDKLHKILDKEALPLNQKMLQVANKMEMATEKPIEKLGTDILTKLRKTQAGQHLMEFKDAHGMHQQIQRMMGRLDAYKIGQWKADLAELDKALTEGKEAVAKSKGLGKEWESLNQMWKQASDLTKAIAERMGEHPTSRRVLGTDIPVPQTLPKGATKVGKELAERAGADTKQMTKPGPNVGKIGGNAMQLLYPLLNAIVRNMTNQPAQAQQGQ